MTDTESRHRGGITIVWREESGCKVESATSFGMNVVIFTITVERKFWYVVGAYITLNDQPTVHQVEKALARGPAGEEMLLFGEVNSPLEQPRDQREEDLVTAIADYGLVEKTLPFIPGQRYIEKVFWPLRMWRDGSPITVREE